MRPHPSRAGAARTGEKAEAFSLFAVIVWLTFHGAPVWAGRAPGSGILGSPHYFRNKTYHADEIDGPCIFCHARHNSYRRSGGPGAGAGSGPRAPDAFDYLPLWDHELTANYASYTMYQNGTGAPGAGAKASQAAAGGLPPGSSSLLCLSCHDGSVAVDSYGNLSQPASGPNTIGAQYAIGKDNYLGNHHPVGFDYDAVRAVDTEIRSAEMAMLGAAGPVRDHLYGASNSMMECGTCHSVHNSGNTGESLLWRSDVRSQLCLTCHDKGNDPGMATP